MMVGIILSDFFEWYMQPFHFLIWLTTFQLGMIPRYNLQPCISRTRHIGEFGMHEVRSSSIKPYSVKYFCQNPLHYKELNYAAVKISNGSKVNWKEFELLKYDTRDEELVYSTCYDPQNFSGITGPFISQKLDPSLIF